jgi:ATPase subunit of ABC transporter with duplicated ATPase domains
MISFSNINKQYGKQLLFVDASLQLNPGEKVGLVGPNGAGKTTLFRMVVGEETPDEGAVSVPKKLTIGYFRQDVEEMQGRSVLDEAIAGSGRVGDLHHESRRRSEAIFSHCKVVAYSCQNSSFPPTNCGSETAAKQRDMPRDRRAKTMVAVKSSPFVRRISSLLVGA